MRRLANALAQASGDLRSALRSLVRSPGFALATAVTIALGVGINAALFSLINSVAFRSVPGGAPQELIAVNQEVVGIPRGSNNSAQFSTMEYETYRDQATTVGGLLAYGRLWLATLGGERAELVVATPVSCNFFEVLQIPAAAGRSLREADCASPTDARVAVVTDAFWQSRFGGDPDAIGQTVTLNGTVLEIVGVAPPGFAGIDIDRPAMFVPLSAQEILRPDRPYLDDDFFAWLNVVGRLAPGVSAAQAEAELAVIGARLDAQTPGRRTTVTVARATPLSAPDMRLAIFGAWSILTTAFGLVLLVACTNVANLMLARADTRMRDTAIRLSLGATRLRLVRQLVAESLLIAIAGGLAGAAVAAAGFRWLVATILAGLPADAGVMLRIEPVFDVRVFAFALGVSVLAGIGFGLAPALAATRPSLRTMIEQDAAAAGGRSRGRVRGALVGVQVAFSMVLVVATALMLRALYEVQSVDPRFDHGRLAVASIDLRAFGYEPEIAAAVQREAQQLVRALPGVDDVALALLTPLEPRNRRYSFRLPEQPQGEAVAINNVSPNFFAVTGIDLLRGRSFTQAEADAQRSTAVILSESTARAYWPDEDPLGKTLVFESFEESIVEVVGIARDTEVVRIGETDTRYIYMPAVSFAQAESQLVIRTSVPATALSAPIESIYASLAPQVPVVVRGLAENFVFWQAISSVAAGLSFGLAVLALALASIGVYGVMATVVGRRIREIGIRLALGAVRGDVLTLVLRKSLRPALVGAVVGILACLGIGRLLSSLLFGVSPLDPVALAGALAAVLGAAAAACIIPARRAMRVDPMHALRYE